MQRLNYHHLQYFWAVAHDGNLTRTAKRLRVAQSALSSQIRQLEADLGVVLFHREGRTLVLSEEGRLALEYADTIFDTGADLLTLLESGRSTETWFRVGAVATLSRNFQESFVRPLLDDPQVRLSLQSGGLDALLARLEEHSLDIVLSNRPARANPAGPWRSVRLARQAVSVVGGPRPKALRFPEGLTSEPLILPGPDSQIRTEFDALCARLGIEVEVAAEVDDMATMRLVARDTKALAVLPSVVVRDELREARLLEHFVVPEVFETFYAITVQRRFQHPLLERLLRRDPSSILAMERVVDSAGPKGS